MQAFLVGNDVEDEEKTASEMGGDSSTGRGLAPFAIIYKMPPWHIDARLLRAVAPVAPDLTAATRLTCSIDGLHLREPVGGSG